VQDADQPILLHHEQPPGGIASVGEVKRARKAICHELKLNGWPGEAILCLGIQRAALLSARARGWAAITARPAAGSRGCRGWIFKLGWDFICPLHWFYGAPVMHGQSMQIK